MAPALMSTMSESHIGTEFELRSSGLVDASEYRVFNTCRQGLQFNLRFSDANEFLSEGRDSFASHVLAQP